MAVQKFEDLIAWQKVQEIVVDVYTRFNTNSDFNFKYQICSAVVSLSNNIAEGFGRSFDADFSRFLYIASASSSKNRSMLHLSERLNYINR